LRRNHGPERFCLVERASKSPDALIRFVLGPDGTVVPDLAQRLPGRGVWVTATAEAIGAALRRKLFARGFKGAAAPPSLVLDIERLLERDALQALSFANKAGEAVTGFARVERAITTGAAVVILNAREAAADGVRKIEQAIRRTALRGPPPLTEQLPVINAFGEGDLGLALGGARVIHAALVAGPASAGFLARWRRLARFRGTEPAERAGADAAATKPLDGP
jgi:uncharacterized protein